MRATDHRLLRRAVAALAALILSACASTHYRPVSDASVRVGAPYRVHGATYVPVADSDYDEVGYASWYGTESGSVTANGERFQADWMTAASRTLPLPSYVEVTALDSGRTILVRVNDRGPFGSRRRIIDLSEGAAERLGIKQAGVAPVRVRLVDPSAADRERLREGHPAKARPRVPEELLVHLRAKLRDSLAAH